MENMELNKILFNQIKERDDMIKTLSDNMIKLSDAYIIKDKEKDKKHFVKEIITIFIMSFIVCFFIWSYFWSSYNDHSVTSINGNGNATISGNNNTNNQNGGAK